MASTVEGKFNWSEQSLKAAQLLADGVLKDQDIADQCGVSRQRITRWKRRGEFREKVREIVATAAKALNKQGVPDLEERLSKMADVVRRIEMVIAGRAEDMPDVPGGLSGLLVRDYRGRSELMEVYKFDAALVKEYRECLRHVAIELGEWTEKKDVTSGGEALTFAALAIMATDGK